MPICGKFNKFFRKFHVFRVSGTDGDDASREPHTGQFQVSDHVEDLVPDDLVGETQLFFADDGN